MLKFTYEKSFPSDILNCYLLFQLTELQGEIYRILTTHQHHVKMDSGHTFYQLQAHVGESR